MITIANLRNRKPCEEWEVRVDRSSVLGNPFRMYDESQRDAVCDKYAAYFARKVEAKDEAFMQELRRLYKIHRKYGKLVLYCWCVPKRCHAETIKAFLDRYI